ncbi:MAG: TlpA disulfide reductase family protein, partial [Finegoldia magna]
FVLSEKTDLENTEAFDKKSVKGLSNLSTKDINGKDFSSKDFSKYDLTMVNVFATWCSACVNEIPDLSEVQKEMKNKGVNIVGVVTDTVDDNGTNNEALQKSKLIQEKTKASYPFLMPDKSNFNGRLNGIQAMPETFFVDKNGNIIGETYSGAKSKEEWKQVIEKELANLKNK